MIRQLSRSLFECAKETDGAALVGTYLLATAFHEFYREFDDRRVMLTECEALFQRFDSSILELFSAVENGSRDRILDASISLTMKLVTPWA